MGLIMNRIDLRGCGDRSLVLSKGPERLHELSLTASETPGTSLRDRVQIGNEVNLGT